MKAFVVLLALFGLSGFGVKAQTGSERLIELDVKSTGRDRLFYVEVQLGEGNKSQPFNLLLSTWTQDVTWIKSVSLSESRGYKTLGTCISPTGDLVAVEVRGSMFRSLTHRDTWQLGSERLVNQSFQVLYPYSILEHKVLRPEIDGILSLNVGNWRQRLDYLQDSLKSQALVENRIFSLYINHTVDVSSQLPLGKLILGGIDPRYYSGAVTYVPMELESSKTMTKVRLDWSRVKPSKRTSSQPPEEMEVQFKWFHLDTTTVHYAGPSKDLDKIHLDFLGAKLIIGRSIYAFNDCDGHDKPDIVFEFAGGLFNVTLAPNDYVIPTKINGRQICISAFKRLAGRAAPNVWLLGTQFLRKHYTIFDPDQAMVGFAKAN